MGTTMPSCAAHLVGTFMAATMQVAQAYQKTCPGQKGPLPKFHDYVGQSTAVALEQAKRGPSGTFKMQRRAHRNQPVIDGKGLDQNGHLLTQPRGHPQLCKGREHKCIPPPRARGHQSNTEHEATVKMQKGERERETSIV